MDIQYFQPRATICANAARGLKLQHIVRTLEDSAVRAQLSLRMCSRPFGRIETPVALVDLCAIGSSAPLPARGLKRDMGHADVAL